MRATIDASTRDKKNSRSTKATFCQNTDSTTYPPGEKSIIQKNTTKSKNQLTPLNTQKLLIFFQNKIIHMKKGAHRASHVAILRATGDEWQGRQAPYGHSSACASIRQKYRKPASLELTQAERTLGLNH
jgi:hypothetical protein